MNILKVSHSYTQILRRTVSGLGVISPAVVQSDALIYRQYGLYAPTAVRREGQLLLTRAGGLVQDMDCNALTALHKRYSAWCKKLQQLKCTQLVHGEFRTSGQVVLYTRALQQECAHYGWDYVAYRQSVLVHEYTHALHFAAILARFGACSSDVQTAAYKDALRYWYGGRTQAAQARTVKETLAEFSRYEWCCENGQDVLAQDLVQSLVGARAFYPSYPYAGVRPLCALYKREPLQAAAAFAKLWQVSLVDWQQAYKLLQQGDILHVE